MLLANAYLVQRYNNPNGPTRKYKGTELYLLPPMSFPSDPLDTINVRHLNYSHSPIPSSLKKTLNIELYDDTYFPSTGNTIQDTTTNKRSSLVDRLDLIEHENIESFDTISRSSSSQDNLS